VPSKRIINISSVTRDKKGHYLIKAGPYSFSLNENAFTDGFYYEGKELSESDLSLLKEESNLTLLSDYAYSLLSRRNYSRHEIKEKLLQKTNNEKSVSHVIKELEKYGLLDDETYAKDYKESREAALYGKNLILNELRYKKGISPNILEKLTFTQEKENAKKYLLRLSRSLTSYPPRVRNEKAKNALCRRGYSLDTFDPSLLEGEEDKVINKLNFEANRAYLRYKEKYSDYECFAHLYSFLLRKGYERDDVENAIRSIKNEHL